MKKLFLILILASVIQSGKIKFIEKGESVRITVVKKKELKYFLLKKDNPIAFEVEGPLFLRVYTRLIFEKGVKDTGYYKIILQEDEERERIISKKTSPSNVAMLSNFKVGKWRSFLIEVPPGRHIYKLILWDSPLGNVAVKIKESAPPQWIEVSPLGSPEVLTSIENERIISYYLTHGENPLELKIEGPLKMKILVRVNFISGMGDETNFTLSVMLDGKEILRTPVRTYRSQVVYWREKKNVTPSKVEQFYIEIPEGIHTLSVKVLGSLAPSSCFRFLKLKRGVK